MLFLKSHFFLYNRNILTQPVKVFNVQLQLKGDPLAVYVPDIAHVLISFLVM